MRLMGLLLATLTFMLAYSPVLYAEQLTVTVDTDRRFYREGDSMQVYGEVSQLSEDASVNIKIVGPKGILFSVSVLPEYDQQMGVARYSYSFPLVSENLVTGSYMIIAEYQKAQTSTTVAILRSFDLSYTQNHDSMEVVVKNHRLSKVNLSSLSLLLENIANPSFSFPAEWQISIGSNENAVQLDTKGFNLEAGEDVQFSIKSDLLLSNSYDLCWSSYGSSMSIWLCNPVAIVQDNTVPAQNAPEQAQNATVANNQNEPSKEDIANKIRLPELKTPGIETLIIGYAFDMDVSEIKPEIEELLEKDESIYYPIGSIDQVYYGSNITASDTNLNLKSNDGKLDFTFYIDDLSIENEYINVNLDIVQLDGYALYNEEDAMLNVTIPPQAA
ncbi:MAG TPA: hypothetical protein VI698_05695, partial [Nitrososphaerales archaeon]|nr:hypothetical protein [Nitrososphaerales archaeon]